MTKKEKEKWKSLPILTWKLTFYKEDEKGNQKFYEPPQDFDYSSLSESVHSDEIVEIDKEDA
jgi:hypothetical protein